METDALRALTLEHCTRLGGKLWPNGIGFDRGGYTYTYQERLGTWCAARKFGFASIYGEGTTPEDARLACVGKRSPRP